LTDFKEAQTTGYRRLRLSCRSIKLAVPLHWTALDHFQRLSCDTGSLTALYVSESGANLIKLNQRPPFDFLTQPKKPKENGKT
jgi:hypothetical protein